MDGFERGVLVVKCINQEALWSFELLSEPMLSSVSDLDQDGLNHV